MAGVSGFFGERAAAAAVARQMFAFAKILVRFLSH